MFSQASRIAKKFGGVRRLAAALGYAPDRVYRWTYDRKRGGTGGLIPAASVSKVQTAADLADIVLTDEDWAPT
jgi:hypothetical protein